MQLAQSIIDPNSHGLDNATGSKYHLSYAHGLSKRQEVQNSSIHTRTDLKMQVAQNIIHPDWGAWKCNEFRTSSIPILTCIYHPLVNNSREMQQAQISSIQSKYHPSGSTQYQKATSSQYHLFQCACQYIIHFYDYGHENGTNSDIIHP
jgi:hypothetical protein